MHVRDIVFLLEQTDSTKEKEAILNQHKDNEVLKKVFSITYNKRQTFGITGKGLNFNVGGVGPMLLEQFCDELTLKYISREFTGNKAFMYMQQMLDNMSRDSCEIARRILARDMECGVSTSICNKVWPGLIAEQPCFLAESFSLKALSKIKWPALAQLKADGSRCMALVGAEGITLVSRGGNEYLNLKDIVAQLEQIRTWVYAALPWYGDFVIDGELIHKPAAVKKPKKFSLDDMLGELTVEDATMDEFESDRNKSNGLGNKSLNGTISDEEQSEMVFNVWDIVPQEVFYGREPSKLWYENRFATLSMLVTNDDGKSIYPNIQLIESEEVASYEEALVIYRKYVDQDREGIILKNKDGLWADARTADQIKFKEEIEVDLRVVAVYPHKKDPNKVGGITVTDASGSILVNCGSGFKDTTTKKDKVTKKKVPIPLDERHEYDRELLMSKKDWFVGQIVQVKCNGLQTRKGRKAHEAKYKLFLPIFQLIRHDKSKPNHIHDVFPDAILD